MPFFAGFFSDSLKKHAYYCLAFGHLHLSLLPAITFSLRVSVGLSYDRLAMQLLHIGVGDVHSQQPP